MAVLGLQLLFAQLIRPQSTWILLAVGCAQVWFLGKRHLSRREGNRTLQRWDERLLLVLCVLIALGNILSAMTPEVRDDPLQYHISFPSRYILHGGFYENAWHYFSYMPLHVETLYTLALTVGRDHLAKLIHCAFGILVAFVMFCFARRMHSRRAGLWAAFLWLVTPQVAWLSSACFIDLALTAWVLTSVLSLTAAAQQTDQRMRSRWLLAAGISSGFFLGGKYTTALIAYIPLCLLWLVWLGRRQRPTELTFWKEMGLLTVPAALVACPVFIKNWLLTGNPFFPILAGVVGTARYGIDITHAKVMSHTPPADIYTLTGFLRWFGVRWTGVNYAGTFILNLAGIALLTTALFWARQKRRLNLLPEWIRYHVLFVVAAWMMNLLCCNNMDGRFFLPIVPLICVLIGVWLCSDVWNQFSGIGRHLGRLLPILLIVVSLFGFALERYRFADIMEESLVPVLSESARSQYYERHIPKYDVVEYINANLPEDSCILSIGYPAARRTIGTACGTPNPIHAVIGRESYSADELLAAFRTLGVTHFVHPGSNALLPDAVDALINRGQASLVYQSNQGYALYAVDAQ